MSVLSENAGPRRRSPLRWLVLLVVCLLAALVAFIASGAALNLLAVDEPAPAARSLVLLDGDFRFELAAELWRNRAVDRIVIVECYPERVVRLKLLPSREARALERLAEAGVPPEAIEVVGCRSRTMSQALEWIAGWLEERPGVEAAVYCDQLQGSRLALARKRVVKPHTAARMRIVCLPDHDLDQRLWWRHRQQARAVANAWFDLALDFVFGDVPPKLDTWDADAYERSLR